MGIMLDDLIAGRPRGALRRGRRRARPRMADVSPEADWLARALLDAARTGGVMVATAESCTGGLVAAAITSVAGSSDVFDRGFVTYSYPSKTDLLGVSPALLAATRRRLGGGRPRMAEGALVRSAARATVAVTGVAGPGGSEAKPEGLVWFATATAGGDTRAERRDFGPLGRAPACARRASRSRSPSCFRPSSGCRRAPRPAARRRARSGASPR
jgi:nicotinamide-nucleotide amidase